MYCEAQTNPPRGAPNAICVTLSTLKHGGFFTSAAA
jgi:hypothetical protein